MAVEYVTYRPVSERMRRTSPVATRQLHLCWVIASLAALAVTSAHAQQDLDAGKTGAQLFAQDCAACHRSHRGLVKTMSGGSLVGFLRQHYTSSSASAGTVAAYVLGSGGNDPRQKGDQAKGSKQARPTDPNAPAQPGAQPTTRQRDHVARPGDPSDPQGRPGKKSRRQPLPDAGPSASAPASSEPAAAAATPAEATTAAVPAEPPRPPAGVPAAAAPGFGEPIP
jgi:mono/diheme cytochrome c family protein